MYIPEERDEKIGYRPNNLYYRIKGNPKVYYDYNENKLDRDWTHAKVSYPDLIPVIESVKAVGLMPYCSEMVIWIDFRDRFLIRRGQCCAPKIADQIAEKIKFEEEASIFLKQLYFTLVLPVAAAVDVGYIDIACGIYKAEIDRLKLIYDIRE